jgi:hypothetical protein
VTYDTRSSDTRQLEETRKRVRDGDLNVKLVNPDERRRRLGSAYDADKEVFIEEYEFTARYENFEGFRTRRSKHVSARNPKKLLPVDLDPRRLRSEDSKVPTLRETEDHMRERRLALVQRRQINAAAKLRMLNQLPPDGSSQWAINPFNRNARHLLSSADTFAQNYGDDLPSSSSDADYSEDEVSTSARFSRVERRRLQLLSKWEDQWEDDFVYDEEVP